MLFRSLRADRTSMNKIEEHLTTKLSEITEQIRNLEPQFGIQHDTAARAKEVVSGNPRVILFKTGAHLPSTKISPNTFGIII